MHGKTMTSKIILSISFFLATQATYHSSPDKPVTPLAHYIDPLINTVTHSFHADIKRS